MLTSNQFQQYDLLIYCVFQLMQVLTTGFWPSAPSSEGLVVPEEVRALQKQFNDFYVSKYQGRRLVWAHALER